ncbi:MAG: hypothetical protein Q4D38_11815, partial [Planctomycetia bacterium]|nr:hypothetical protein [Planctomycetia bacterium]
MIQQLYITHCTRATSALERKQGEMNDAPLGYSVRSASIQGTALRDVYRRLERYVYYYLPDDTPAQDREFLTSKTAPIRLVCLPEADFGSLALNVAYRPKDTAGRIGSYFAHAVAVSKNAQNAQNEKTPLDPAAVLKTWGASAWVLEDAPFLSYDIPPLVSLDELSAHSATFIDDRVLLSFLKMDESAEFYDPGGVIPERWRKMPLEKRAHYFKMMLAGLLTHFDQPSESVLFAVEPSVAALLFYGACRFFPRSLMKKLSFSTYESHPERVFTKIAASTFASPLETDFPDEIYKGARFVCNTWSGRTSDFDPQTFASSYVSHVWRHFLAGGLNQVQTFWKTFDSVGVASMLDLNALTNVEEVFHQIVMDIHSHANENAKSSSDSASDSAADSNTPQPQSNTPPAPPPPPIPSAPPTPPTPPPVLVSGLSQNTLEDQDSSTLLPAELSSLPLSSSKAALVFLKRRILDYLSKNTDSESVLKHLLGKNNQMLLLEILVGKGGEKPEIQKHILYLLNNLSEEQFPLWLERSPLPDATKLRFVEARARRSGGLPAGCDFLRKLPVSYISGDQAPCTTILPSLLATADDSLRAKIYAQSQNDHWEKEFLLYFASGVSLLMDVQGLAASESARAALDAHIASTPFSLLYEIYDSDEVDFFRNYPGDSSQLGAKFVALEQGLFDDLSRLPAKLDILFEVQEILPSETQNNVRNWRRVQEVLHTISLSQKGNLAKKTRKYNLVDAMAKNLAESASRAFPNTTLASESNSSAQSIANSTTKKIEIIKILARSWENIDLFPEDNPTNILLWKKIRRYFQTQTWPKQAARDFWRSNQMILIILGGVSIGLFAVLLFFLLNTPAPSTPQDADLASSGSDPTSSSPDGDPLQVGQMDEKSDVKVEYVENEFYSQKKDSSSEASKPEKSDKSSEKRTAPAEKSPKPRALFEKTSAQQIRDWITLLETGSHGRPSLFAILPRESAPNAPRNLPTDCVLISKDDVQTNGEFHSSEMRGISLSGGVLIFEGTAFPFGALPSELRQPTRAATPQVPTTDSSNTAAQAPKPRRSKNVLGAEDIVESEHGAVIMKDKLQSTQAGERYDIPTLAEALGFQSVLVELVPSDEGLVYIIVRVVRKALLSEDVQRQTVAQEEIDRQEKELRTLKNRISGCESAAQMDTSWSKKLAEFKNLARLLGKEDRLIFPSEPNRKDFRTERGYHAAVEAYQRSRTTRDRVLESLLEEARREAAAREEALAQARYHIVPTVGVPTPAEAEALARLQRGVTQIVALFDREGGFSKSRIRPRIEG